jgi:mRNA interferase MazF
MTRGEVWIAEVGRKHRPVLVLTRTEVIDVRTLVTVAEITTNIRGIGAEVMLDHRTTGLERESAVNCDGLHTVTQALLTHRVGQLDDTSMQQVCSAVNYALGC